MILLKMNNLDNTTIINFHSDCFDNDDISILKNNVATYVDAIFYNLPLNAHTIFETIQQDPEGKKLFNEYKKMFPHLLLNVESFDFGALKSKSIISLWKLVRVMLGFETTVSNHAMACMLEKDTTIEYKNAGQWQKKTNAFDFIALLKQGMQFKLSLVKNNTIALWYVESYANFIVYTVEKINKQIPLDSISLCGDIFSNNLISNFVHKSITKNYKIYYNKDFVIQVS